MTAIDLFAGAGGSSLGATMAGARVLAAINHWAVAVQTHEANLPETEHLLSRVEHVDPRAYRGIDLLLASPECTNHSRAKGAKPRDEQSRMTAWEVVRFAEHAQPRWIVVENVPEITRWGLYGPWRAALEALGYRIREQVLDASEFGVAEARRRYFLVAGRGATPPAIVPPGDPKRTIGDLIQWDTYPFRSVAGKVPATQRKIAAAVAALGPTTPFLLVYYGSGPQWQTLDRPLRTITTRDRFGLVVPGPRGHQIRMLQPSELKAAHGFPADYRLLGTREDQVVQIGNAVVPPVMESIVRALRRAG